MQIIRSDPNAVGFGDNSIDSPGEFGKSQELEDNQQQFASFLRSENEDYDDEIGESGGGDDELLEFEADDDSVLDLKLSDEITEESDQEIEDSHDLSQEHAQETEDDRADVAQKRSQNMEEARQEADLELDRQNDMEDAELVDLDDLQLGIDPDGDAEMEMLELDQDNPMDEVDSFSKKEGRSAGYEDALGRQ